MHGARGEGLKTFRCVLTQPTLFPQRVLSGRRSKTNAAVGALLAPRLRGARAVAPCVPFTRRERAQPRAERRQQHGPSALRAGPVVEAVH